MGQCELLVVGWVNVSSWWLSGSMSAPGGWVHGSM